MLMGKLFLKGLSSLSLTRIDIISVTIYDRERKLAPPT